MSVSKLLVTLQTLQLTQISSSRSDFISLSLRHSSFSPVTSLLIIFTPETMSLFFFFSLHSLFSALHFYLSLSLSFQSVSLFLLTSIFLLPNLFPLSLIYLLSSSPRSLRLPLTALALSLLPLSQIIGSPQSCDSVSVRLCREECPFDNWLLQPTSSRGITVERVESILRSRLSVAPTTGFDGNSTGVKKKSAVRCASVRPVFFSTSSQYTKQLSILLDFFWKV